MPTQLTYSFSSSQYVVGSSPPLHITGVNLNSQPVTIKAIAIKFASDPSKLLVASSDLTSLKWTGNASGPSQFRWTFSSSGDGFFSGRPIGRASVTLQPNDAFTIDFAGAKIDGTTGDAVIEIDEAPALGSIILQDTITLSKVANTVVMASFWVQSRFGGVLNPNPQYDYGDVVSLNWVTSGMTSAAIMWDQAGQSRSYDISDQLPVGSCQLLVPGTSASPSPAAGSSPPTRPSRTTTYNLICYKDTVQRGGGSATVIVESLHPVLMLNENVVAYDPNPSVLGLSLQLTWNCRAEPGFEGDYTCTLDPGNGAKPVSLVDSSSGATDKGTCYLDSKTFTKSTTLTLTATRQLYTESEQGERVSAGQITKTKSVKLHVVQCSLTAQPTEVLANGTTTLTWQSSGATSWSLQRSDQQAPQALPAKSGSMPLQIPASLNVTLSALRYDSNHVPKGASSSISLRALSASLSASPSPFGAGDNVTLNFSCSDADSINWDFGDGKPPTVWGSDWRTHIQNQYFPSIQYLVTSETQKIVMTAQLGSLQVAPSVQAVQMPPQSAFTASNMGPGDGIHGYTSAKMPINLNYQIKYATQCSITPDVGQIDLSQGYTGVEPVTMYMSTIFTLTCQNSAGQTDTKKVYVYVSNAWMFRILQVAAIDGNPSATSLFAWINSSQAGQWNTWKSQGNTPNVAVQGSAFDGSYAFLAATPADSSVLDGSMGEMVRIDIALAYQPSFAAAGALSVTGT